MRGVRDAVLWLGHNQLPLLWPVLALMAAGDALAWPVPLGTAAACACAAVGLSASPASRYHHQRPCRLCAAESRPGCGAAVGGHRTALALYHLSQGGSAAVLAVIACQVPALMLVSRDVPVWAVVLSAAGVPVLVASAAVTRQHRRLRPWCPFCPPG